MSLQLSPDLELRIEDIHAARIALLGKSGSGKTNTMQVIASACRAHSIPYTFINPISPLHPMPGAVVVRWRDATAITITETSAPILAETAVRERLTVLIDLRMCPAAERMPIVTAYMERLWAMLLEQETPSPYGVFIDEAQLFAPQDGNSTVKPVLVDMAMRGRHMGVISVVATQRPAKIDKDVLNQASLTIVHRLSAQTDTKILGDQLPDITPRHLNQMMRKLSTGQAVVIGDPVFLGDADYRTVQVYFAGQAEQGGSTPVLSAPAREVDSALLERLRNALAMATKPSIQFSPRIEADDQRLSTIPMPEPPDEIAQLQRQIAELNDKVMGLYRQLSQLAPQTPATRPAQPAGGTQLSLLTTEQTESVVVEEERVTTRTTAYVSSRSLNARMRLQTEGFERLKAQLAHMSRFQRALLLTLAEEPARVYHVNELAPRFDRAPKTVYETLLALERMCLVKKLKTRVYASAVEEFITQQYPDLTVRDLFERMVHVLAA